MLLALLVLAPAAFASAGDGSSGFSGGDGGGGFGGGGGGRGFALFLVFRVLLDIALLGHGVGALVLIGLGLVWWFWSYGEPKVERWWHARNRRGRAHRRDVKRRQRQVEMAAAEAADQNSVFGPEYVKLAAAQLFTDVQLGWSEDDRATLKRLIAPDLYVEWEKRLDDFNRRGWQNKVEPSGRPTIEYVGLRRKRRGSGDGSEAEGDRVVVRIDAKLRDYVVDRSGRRIKRDGSFTETTRMREYWTLEWIDDAASTAHGDDSDELQTRGHWVLASIESGAEGEYSLKDEIVQTDWADTQGLQDEALVEGANADAQARQRAAANGSATVNGSRTSVADLADLSFSGDARAAALDLSLADGRFAPDVLAVAARRAVSGWALAVDGPDDELLKIATADAAREMLHPQDPSAQTRMVVRGLQVQRIRITGVDAATDPATMTIDVDLRGRRYIEERATTRVLAGSDTRLVGFTERWTLALTGDAENPWRIVSVQTPAGAL
jgi:predicted lipid-binding transport protein (Tim44 family)